VSEILFITAEPESRAGALRALEEEGIFAKVVENWDLARESFATRQVDLVIVDRTTTALQVTDLVATLPLADPLEVDIPVILLGSNTAWELRARELRAGASDFIDLPFEPQELGALISARLRTKKRIDDLKSEALVDELTGVYNRRFLDSEVAAKLAEARRYGHPFSCALLDVDRFKSINDTWGHQVGDAVLRGEPH
jgi:two-component system cell cycle response regulator